MKTSKTTAVVATAVVLMLGASACSGSDDDNGGGGGSKGSGATDAALTSVVNKSDKKGGTVKIELSDEPDSLDPGNTYYGWVQNLSRLYGRTLTSFKPAAGKDGLEVVPDLAEGLGKSSADAKTWTYTLKKGLKFEDGTPITSKDVKYAVERSNFAPEALSNGPTYFKAHLAGGDKYKGPYKDKSAGGISSIETPDDTTIVFKLKDPFADFDYLATFSQTAPVPVSEGQGCRLREAHRVLGPVQVRVVRRGPRRDPRAQLQLGPEDRPEPSGSAGQGDDPLQGEAGDGRQQPDLRQHHR